MKKRSKKDWEMELNLQAWKDPEFKKRLMKNPAKVLKELGCTSGIDPKKVKIVEETEDAQIIVLYKAPAKAATMSETTLEEIMGGCCGSLASMVNPQSGNVFCSNLLACPAI